MAYLGDRKLAEVDPTHPFAHDQISFVPKRENSGTSSSVTPGARLPEAPVRDQFQSQEEYEEALGYWQANVGKIKGLAKLATSKDSPTASGSTDET